MWDGGRKTGGDDTEKRAQTEGRSPSIKKKIIMVICYGMRGKQENRQTGHRNTGTWGFKKKTQEMMLQVSVRRKREGHGDEFLKPHV